MSKSKIKQGIGFVSAEGRTVGIQSARPEEKVIEMKPVECANRDLNSRLSPVQNHGGDFMGEARGNPVEIFLVEDNAGDVRLTREAFADARVSNRLHVVHDGVAALQFLRKEKPYADAPDPDLVLLDLNIPKLSGFEVLEQIKSAPLLKKIPVIIWTSSKADCDVQRCYNSCANSYVTKPTNFDQYMNVVAAIDQFWLSTVRLPGREI
jgi:chemotaxis family two-component system response regulator Rcp1